MIRLNKRQQFILDEIESQKFVEVNALSEKSGVSTVTIRKDLKYLENNRLLYRTHGGASKESQYAFERNVNEKEFVQVSQKKKIAEEALKFINNNDFIILASGTSIHYLARILTGFKKLTVVTPALYVSLELTQDPFIDVIQLGGTLRKSSASVIGIIPETDLKGFSCNKLFLGADGISVTYGLTTSNAPEAHLNQIMIESSEKVIVLADSTKINKRGFGKICDIEHVDILITDSGISKEDLEAFENIGIEVIVAK